MAVYEYLCRVCDARFEARRPMAEASDPINCPQGHAETTRRLSVFASVGAGAASGAAPSAPASRPMGGGCGGGCACAH